MTTAPPTRRERLRTATVIEIKDAARRLLVTGGPAAISLRAIARDMGMTAPAIYRYFSSLDALIVDLTADLYDEVRHVVVAAREAEPASEPVRQLASMARAFRRWSVTKPAEFGLMFGSPVPGVTAFEDDCDHETSAAAQFGEAFLGPLGELWATGRFVTPPPELISRRLGAYLGPCMENHGDLPVEVIYVFLSAWTRLYGIVALEVFGHLRWALSEEEPLFEMELAFLLDQLTGGSA
jgi:AcrR family transcriptional regulator